MIQCIYRKKKGDSFSFYGYHQRYLPTDSVSLDDKHKMHSEDVKKQLNISPKGYRHLDPCVFYTGKDEHYVAIGLDQFQKSQYMYNPQFAEEQRRKKYCQLASMIRHMHHLHKKTKDILHMKGGSVDQDEKRYALLYQMMNVCRFRIGSQDDSFAQSIGKKTYGIRTIQKQHVSFSGKHMKISFLGKKGVLNECTIKQPTLIHEMKELYQQTRNAKDALFRLSSTSKPISYQQWQSYLKQHHVSESKMIRTYYANYLFIDAWKKQPHLQKGHMKDIITNIANELHHTPAILKKSYLSRELYQFALQNDTSMPWIKKYMSKSTEKALYDFFHSYCSWSAHSHKKK
jgi:DNA topoisomerase I